MAEKKARIYKWYIEPLDSNTNSSIAREISEENELEIHDDQGDCRKVYLVPPKKLGIIRNSKAQAGLRFNVLVQEGGGKIRPANFRPAARKRKELRLPATS